MKRKELPTQAEIKQLLHYDDESGVFRWRFSTNNRVKPWGVAGVLADRYYRIGINKKSYQAHRLAWVYMTGEPPKDEIDHIDGNGSNNAWANLREATQKQNMENTPLYQTNKSGFRGVCWKNDRKKWRARVQQNGKGIHVGYFTTAEEAAQAAAEKRAELFTHDTGRDLHGRQDSFVTRLSVF